ncbi:MAG TPA: hypothetical protein VER79_12495 [Candidatus Limnocylindrales bacterium]|nr:hypothetical protein [Candidatus Limnocylindrales bacterium]
MNGASWAWVSAPFAHWRALARLLVKTAVWFVALNLLFALLNPLPVLGRVTLYNGLFPGRERLPYGETPAVYNLSLDNLNAMFASHILSQPKASDEFRIIAIGDSSVWGTLLRNDETLAGLLDAAGLSLDGRTVRVYNAGYPTMSLAKDLLMLDRAMQYAPDLILWPVTMESMPVEDQLDAPIVRRSPEAMRAVIDAYGLTSIAPDDPRFIDPTFLERTIVGARRPLADLARLQMFGIAWAGTGIDQVYPDYTPRTNDLEPDESWHGRTPDALLTAADLAFDVLDAGRALAGAIPVLLVNEPIFRADGANSDLRYNAWYPRWAYDQYRVLLADYAATNDVLLLDLWDTVPPAEFTDSPVHLTPAGAAQMADAVTAWLQSLAAREH